MAAMDEISDLMYHVQINVPTPTGELKITNPDAISSPNTSFGDSGFDSATSSPSKAGSVLSVYRPTSPDGLGVYATKDIQAGTRVLAEDRSLYIEGLHLSSMFKAYQAASPEVQQQIKQLYPGPRKEVRKIALTLKKEHERNDRDHPINIPDLVNATHALASIGNSHALILIGGPDAQAKTDPHILPHILPLTIAKLHHSCLPNCFAAYSERLHTVTLHAIHDITAGAKLTISYLSTNELYSAREQRQQLLNRYDFKCGLGACSACLPAGPAADPMRYGSDKRRTAIAELVIPVNHFARNLANGGCLQETALRENHFRAQLGLQEVVKLIAVMEEEGLINLDLAQFFMSAYHFALELRQQDKAEIYCARCIKIITTCCGEDSPLLQKAKNAMLGAAARYQ